MYCLRKKNLTDSYFHRSGGAVSVEIGLWRFEVTQTVQYGCAVRQKRHMMMADPMDRAQMVFWATQHLDLPRKEWTGG